MSVQTGEAVPSGPASRRIGDRARFRLDRWRTDPNPIWIRELKQAVRLARTPVILCVLTMLMTMVIAGIGGVATTEASPSKTGIIIYHVYFSVAYFVVTLVGPTVAANGIAAEREGRTWEAVLLAGLSPQLIARGKFLAAYTTISLYIVMLAPVGALPFLFGGVTATETIVAFLFLFLIAVMAVAFGLAISSKMTSMRGAIAVTLLLALPFSVMTFLFFGPLLSEAAHKMWPTVPDGPPIWLPTAYSRAPFDETYVLALFVAPVLAIGIPAWFMYEVTIANLTDGTDDRSTGLKLWFVVCTPILAAAATAPIIASTSAGDTLGFSLVAQGLCFLVLTFVVFLFQGDAVGPSRRVLAHWARARAGALMRFMGPSVVRTGLLTLFVGGLCLAALTVVGIYFTTERPTYHKVGPEQVMLFGLYTTGFFAFMLGLGTYLRVRAGGAIAARLILGGTVIALFIVPWVVAAIIGVLNAPSGRWEDDMLSIASPSPAFVFFAISKLESSDPTNAPAAAVACAFGYMLLGLLALVAARSRAAKIMEQHTAMLAQTDRILEQEDEAAAVADEWAEAGGATTGAEEARSAGGEASSEPAVEPQPS